MDASSSFFVPFTLLPVGNFYRKQTLCLRSNDTRSVTKWRC